MKTGTFPPKNSSEQFNILFGTFGKADFAELQIKEDGRGQISLNLPFLPY